ncbi:hypothetical protein BaRGS_00014819 [Batillaria attramentaria]|uniref:Uncharacterized protein n=1 Tax=Batillaria attramentaria TaxID=370345 RepID=A0ABD0L3E3_9CAEN
MAERAGMRKRHQDNGNMCIYMHVTSQGGVQLSGGSIPLCLSEKKNYRKYCACLAGDCMAHGCAAFCDHRDWQLDDDIT